MLYAFYPYSHRVLYAYFSRSSPTHYLCRVPTPGRTLKSAQTSSEDQLLVHFDRDDERRRDCWRSLRAVSIGTHTTSWLIAFFLTRSIPRRLSRPFYKYRVTGVFLARHQSRTDSLVQHAIQQRTTWPILSIDLTPIAHPLASTSAKSLEDPLHAQSFTSSREVSTRAAPLRALGRLTLTAKAMPQRTSK